MRIQRSYAVAITSYSAADPHAAPFQQRKPRLEASAARALRLRPTCLPSPSPTSGRCTGTPARVPPAPASARHAGAGRSRRPHTQRLRPAVPPRSAPRPSARRDADHPIRRSPPLSGDGERASGGRGKWGQAVCPSAAVSAHTMRSATRALSRFGVRPARLTVAGSGRLPVSLALT